MHEHRNIEKEKYTEEYESFPMTDGEFFPGRKYGIDNEATHRNTKMQEDIDPHIVASIDAKCRIFKDGELSASKEF